MNIFNVIESPWITEKGTVLKETQDCYIFKVNLQANKHQIKNAVEKMFSVKVVDVNTVKVRGKFKRVGRSMGQRSNFKKAYVTLREGEKIQIFEGV